MSYQTKHPTFEELTQRGRDVVDIHMVANRYAGEVGTAMRETEQVSTDELVHMRESVKAMLNAVHKHTPIDFGMLLNYPPRAMCHELNQALEHMSSAGWFKEGYRPDWLR